MVRFLNFLFIFFLYLGSLGYGIDLEDNSCEPVSKKRKLEHLQPALPYLYDEDFSPESIYIWMRQMDEKRKYMTAKEKSLIFHKLYMRMKDRDGIILEYKKNHTQMAFKQNPLWVTSWTQEIVPRIPGISTKNLSNMTYELSRFNIKLSQDIEKNFLETASYKISTFTTRDLSTFLTGITHLGIIPSQAWIDNYLIYVTDKIEEFNIYDLSQIIYSLAILSYLPKEGIIPLFRGQIERNVHELTFFQKHQLYLSFKYFAQKSDEHLIEDKKIAIWEREIEESAHETNTVSFLEKDVSKFLKKLKKPFTQGAFIKEIGGIVDFYDSNRKRIIAVDGPSHYLHNGSISPSTIFQTKLLESYGYLIARISYKDWKVNKPDFIKRNILRKALKIFL